MWLVPREQIERLRAEAPHFLRFLDEVTGGGSTLAAYLQRLALSSTTA
jgi:hypothetical protein